MYIFEYLYYYDKDNPHSVSGEEGWGKWGTALMCPYCPSLSVVTATSPHHHPPLSIIIICPSPSLSCVVSMCRQDSFVGSVLHFCVVMVVGWLWFVAGVGCGVVVVVGSMIVFRELERDEQGMGVLTWCPKI
jgi:hypothetical protein